MKTLGYDLYYEKFTGINSHLSRTVQYFRKNTAVLGERKYFLDVCVCSHIFIFILLSFPFKKNHFKRLLIRKTERVFMQNVKVVEKMNSVQLLN